MPSLFDISSLLPALSNKELILTPNRRLAAKIQASYSQYNQQQSSGESHKSWHTPRVFSIEGWQQQLWNSLGDSNPNEYSTPVLTSRQELIIWEQLIANDPESSPLLRPSGLAKHCQQALKTLAFWEVDIESPIYKTWATTDDSLPKWYRQFTKQCKKYRVITQSEQIQSIITAISNNLITPEPSIHLLGFQDIPPLQFSLLKQAADRLHTVIIEDRNAHKHIVPLATAEQEWQQAAVWVKDKVTATPDASIGVVVPDLHQYRDDVERTFRRFIDPDFLSLGQGSDLPGFNLSIGQPLDKTPIVSSGLQLLGLLTKPLMHDQLGTLLHSPFLPGFDKETPGRVMIEQTLREFGQFDYQLSQLISVIETAKRSTDEIAPAANDLANTDTQMGAGQLSMFDTEAEIENEAKNRASDVTACPELLASLRALERCVRPKVATLSEWSQWSYHCLASTGWPGDRNCNSFEYQQLNQWYELLGKLSKFDHLLGKITLSEALSYIRKETQAAIFQPKTEDSLPQILGPLEAAGLQFDYLWICGLSDNQWPATPSPNPLIPVGLQREKDMPHASATRELAFAKELLNALVINSKEVIGSYPLWSDDQPLRLSPLVAHFQPITPETITVATNPIVTRIASAACELIDTSFAPVVSPEEKPSIRGTSGLLKQQALCPFSAFAIHRLNARPLLEPVQGLSALDRGNLVHDALEHFWKKYKTQTEVANLTTIQRSQAIKTSCEASLTKLQRRLRHKRSQWTGKRFYSIEQKRLEKLLQLWINVELERSCFTVFAVEDEFRTALGGLEFKLRIDRIDTLADNSILLIDYKTGETKVSQWKGSRPKEPQLPLYAISSHKNLAAITFATINAKQQAYAGLSRNEGYIADGIQSIDSKNADAEDWDEQLQQWRQTLTQLVTEFMQGNVVIDPLDAAVYGYSGLTPLARLTELEQLANRDDDNE